MTTDYRLLKNCVKVGLIGTGYAAEKRAEAFINHPQSELVAVVGNSQEKTRNFCTRFNIEEISSWQEMLNHPQIDLICICNINREHGTIVKNALLADKHVIVEYPLTNNPEEAEELIKLAQAKQKLLHVEHIEILGGVHQAIKQHLAEIGTPFLARYSTIVQKSKTLPHWTYSYEDYGFPFIAALSRINRFIDLFGKVDTVSCQGRFWDALELGYFSACYTQAELKFQNDMLVTLTYGKGDKFPISDRTLEIHGEKGTLRFVGEKGKIIRGKEEIEIEVGSRRGLFSRDTEIVLQHLFAGTPLYIDNNQSVYSLKVAGAVFQAYQEKRFVRV
jgi:biliverdin reductase